MSFGYVEQMINGRWCAQCGSDSEIDKYFLSSSDTLEGAISILLWPDLPDDERVPSDLDEVECIYVLQDFSFGARDKDFPLCVVKEISPKEYKGSHERSDDESYSLLFPSSFFVWHHECGK